MTEDEDRLHIVFTAHGAMSLRKALRQIGRNDRVICLFDDLSFGPINPSDPELRKRWIETELGFTGWPETPDGPPTPWAGDESGDVGWDDAPRIACEFWNKALSAKTPRTVWWSRQSSMDYANFLEWNWKNDDASYEVADLTNLALDPPREWGPMSLGLLSSDDILATGLAEWPTPLQDADRHHYRAMWQQLRSENAPFRITDGENLTSAPITAFDQMILSEAHTQWRKVARIVGSALCAQSDAHLFQAGEMVLTARIKALADAGTLESQGENLFAMRFSEVRLAPK